jgi:hypothetical protein
MDVSTGGRSVPAPDAASVRLQSRRDDRACRHAQLSKVATSVIKACRMPLRWAIADAGICRWVCRAWEQTFKSGKRPSWQSHMRLIRCSSRFIGQAVEQQPAIRCSRFSCLYADLRFTNTECEAAGYAHSALLVALVGLPVSRRLRVRHRAVWDGCRATSGYRGAHDFISLRFLPRTGTLHGKVRTKIQGGQRERRPVVAARVLRRTEVYSGVHFRRACTEFAPRVF